MLIDKQMKNVQMDLDSAVDKPIDWFIKFGILLEEKLLRESKE